MSVEDLDDDGRRGVLQVTMLGVPFDRLLDLMDAIEWRPAAREGAIARRVLEDGRELTLYVEPFNLRLLIGRPGEPAALDAYYFEDADAAFTALARWDGTGEPAGWWRHPATQRRRPGGDATKEY